ncbi:hypothetical protein [Brevundimonas sp.]|jgi:hypothetical protein|uniref:hypothetical protein n=1 Tax=Brevundimonas sp. TaxID=1871086 RepID=UPI002E0D1C38|nr:hypothetical protein [Brevundimonas sp.]
MRLDPSTSAILTASSGRSEGPASTFSFARALEAAVVARSSQNTADLTREAAERSWDSPADAQAASEPIIEAWRLGSATWDQTLNPPSTATSEVRASPLGPFDAYRTEAPRLAHGSLDPAHLLVSALVESQDFTPVQAAVDARATPFDATGMMGFHGETGEPPHTSPTLPTAGPQIRESDGDAPEESASPQDRVWKSGPVVAIRNWAAASRPGGVDTTSDARTLVQAASTALPCEERPTSPLAESPEIASGHGPLDHLEAPPTKPLPALVRVAPGVTTVALNVAVGAAGLSDDELLQFRSAARSLLAVHGFDLDKLTLNGRVREEVVPPRHRPLQ